MSADDKYPGESGRRRFVKGVVGGAALAGVGLSGSAAINSATKSPGQGGGATEAMAIENTDGPAPRGMPQIPLTIEDNAVKGVWPEVKQVEQNGRQVQIAEQDLGGVTYSQNWFQYCGVETYAGLSPDYGAPNNNFFVSDASPAYEWQKEAMSEGDKFTVDLFSDYKTWGNEIGKAGLGKPATGTWRSADTEDTIPIQIIRSQIIKEMANGQRDVPSDIQNWLKASTEEGFIAWLNKCTHFCCVPGWKQSEGAAKFNAANDVYCQCHQSVYDPFSIVKTLFTARPRPQE